ncbi:DJ-1/PfpI family protein [Solimicrobium silvestre]|uniref:Putative amidotransferase n=1 Tax=Solimicrobium silvestre TaxID=2099400 RepID=A0A2S9H239_9BURK|nr:DJ-1/PfpI family protein [Solimicrobium silvestre]PRC94052.1 putative amidotransferase [Solimicrobium silvestre]
MNTLYRYLLRLFTLATILFGAIATTNAAGAAPKRVAILLFEGVDVIDYAGPLEVFDTDGMQIFTVAATKATINPSDAMKVVPSYTFANAPQADILIVPGGQIDKVQSDPATLAWIKKQSAHATYVMSVCNGAFTLANTGLLSGLKVTTTAGRIDELRKKHPELQVVRDQRVVDNGKFIETGGLTAGIDGALHLVSLIAGDGEAHAIAQQMEYKWLPEGAYLPGTDAFHIVKEIMGIGMMSAHETGSMDGIASSSGDSTQWEIGYRLRSEKTDSDILKHVVQSYTGMALDSGGSAAVTTGVWQYRDAEGNQWNVKFNVDSVPGQTGMHVFKIEAVRV